MCGSILTALYDTYKKNLTPSPLPQLSDLVEVKESSHAAHWTWEMLFLPKPSYYF
jgi:hypothetical protein